MKCLNLRQGDAVRVEIPYAGNVYLVDGTNLSKMRRRLRFNFYGGYYNRSPVVIRPPRGGTWHLVVDVGRRCNFNYAVI